MAAFTNSRSTGNTNTSQAASSPTCSAEEQVSPPEPAAASSYLLTGTEIVSCAGIRKDGERCRARATATNGFCSFHRSDLDETVRAGRIAGGRARSFELTGMESVQASVATLGLDSRGGIQGVLDATLRQLFLGRISPDYVGAVVRLVNAALRNLEHTDPETEDHSLDQYSPSIANLAEMTASLEEQQARAHAAAAARADEFLRSVEAVLLAEK
jgi:hypothetical protein